LIAACGHPPYRARQLRQWVFVHGAADYAAMTNLPQALRDGLEARLPVRSTQILETFDSGDGTRKLLLELHDGERVECVLLPEGDRVTGCISTQVGCGVGCLFCASGADGVVRNLDAAEICEQVLWLRQIAGRRPTNLVVMGMGEPLHNVACLTKALRLLQDPDGLDFAGRRITVSTAGPTRGFEEFLAANVKRTWPGAGSTRPAATPRSSTCCSTASTTATRMRTSWPGWPARTATSTSSR
jgi:23S rRNA (adenine2503-C2)-methyltransferase